MPTPFGAAAASKTPTGINLVAEGDSITANSLLTNYVPKALALISGSISVYGNVANGGATVASISSHATAVDAMWSKNKRNILIVFVGTNDISSTNSNLTAAATFSALKTYCLARIAAGWTVIAGTILDRQDINFPSRNTALNASIAGDHTFYHALADFASDPLLGPDGAADSATYFLDGIHPTDAGYVVMAPYLATALTTVINSGAPVFTTLTGISPSSVTLTAGQTQQYTASATDQYGATIAISPYTISWSTNNGSIDSTGLLTSGAAGTGKTVTAIRTQTVTASFDVNPAVTYATFDAAAKGANVTLSNGNLTETNSGSGHVRATQGKASGKWYWEVTVTTANSSTIGIANSSSTLTNYVGATLNSWGYFTDGSKTHNGLTSYGAAWSSGTIIGVALDMDNGKVWFSKNGVWQASGDPAAGTNAAFTGVTGTIYPASGANSTNAATANFGATTLTYTPPTGFTAGVYA